MIKHSKKNFIYGATIKQKSTSFKEKKRRRRSSNNYTKTDRDAYALECEVAALDDDPDSDAYALECEVAALAAPEGDI
ncbi:hypothetical protein UY3_05315 [Chelonia mydas]|uniref:Uncharacterized protein n=1 Tax=Chelonia mydas TaxID=8469 RepID=M7CA41_CHEMY|nr:hypothetical protein UY3_05315 [Chelonia mydas]